MSAGIHDSDGSSDQALPLFVKRLFRAVWDEDGGEWLER
jgi:hypothetical protein